MSIKLGDRVVDIVTGFTGVVISRIEYINGCIQFGVKPKADKTGMKSAEYIDEKELKIVGKPVVMEKKRTGGTQPDTPRF